MHIYVFLVQVCLFSHIYSFSPDDSRKIIYVSSKDQNKVAKTPGDSNSKLQKSDNIAKQDGKTAAAKLWLKYCRWLEHHSGQNEKLLVFNSDDCKNTTTATQTYHIKNVKIKYLSLVLEDFILRGKLSKTKLSDLYIRDSAKDLFRICRKFIHGYLKHLICDNLLLRNSDEFSNGISFKHRKLLESPTKSVADGFESSSQAMILLQTGGVDGEVYVINNSTFNGLSAKQWKQLLTALHDNMSQDHIWAMLCLVSVVVVMVFGMKMCGMRPVNRQHEIHLDYVFQENAHTVSIREILALKRPYLPKGLARFTKRWRRKPKKKSPKLKQHYISDPTSDNSDEERIIYSQPMINF